MHLNLVGFRTADSARFSGLEKSDELGEWTNSANRWKLYHKSSYTSQ